MLVKNIVCIILSCALLSGTLILPANATESKINNSKTISFNNSNPRATNSFHMSIPANSSSAAQNSFLLMSGETITIKASYAPFDSSVDFGLVDEDGIFHYYNVTDGSINKTMQISESGRYTFLVRNNSNTEIEVSGFINY